MDATPSQYRRLGFVGGVNTVLERGILPTNAFSEKQNFRDKNIGFVSRKGHRKLHTTTDKAQEIKTLHYFIDKSDTKHFYVQRADGSVHKATNNPPIITNGNFGSEILRTISNPISASSTEIDGHFLFADGARQCQIYSGQSQEILKFIVYKGSSTISPAVIVGNGLDDATSGGTYIGAANKKYYKVTIDATGSPDTFKWEYKTSLDASWITGATGISIIGEDFLPTMTSNTTPSPYVASASSELTGYEAYRAFDNALSEWVANAPTGWLKIDLGIGNEAVAILYKITTHDVYIERSPKNWTFEGSNDDVNWTVLDTQTNITDWTLKETKTFKITNSTAYRYYRLNITANNGDANYVHVDELDIEQDGSQILNDGVTISFNAKTGHTLGDYWIFEATGIPMIPQDGEDYTDLIRDDDISRAAILNNLNTLTNYHAIYVITLLPAIKLNFTIPKPNNSTSVVTVKYWSNGSSINTASYTGKSFSIATEETYPTGITFSDDGMKMYIVGTNTDKIFQYSLSTAYDISTASYDNKSFSVATQDTDPRGLAFSNDGTKMYIVGNATDTIYQYSLSIAWDISTASYDNKSFSITTQDSTPTGLFFKTDGTKMYIVGTTNDSIYQYSLSTAWNISTASYDNKFFSVATQETIPTGLFFKSDGTKMYIIGDVNDTVYQYSLSTAWDISTANYDNASFSIASEETSPFALTFNNDGTKMYIIGAATDAVYQYKFTNAFVPVTGFSDGTNLAGASLGQSGSMTWTAPTDEIPYYHFGISGYIYQISFSAQLDSEVEISRITYESPEYVNLENVWDGVMRDVIEGQVYNASEDKYSRESGTLIDVSHLTPDDYVYFNALDRIFAVYVDCSKTVGKKKVSMTSCDISFYDGGTEEDYIKTASGNFLKVGFEAGMKINISGSANNDKTVTIQRISDAGDIIYVQTGTLTAESSGRWVTLSSRIGAPKLKNFEVFNGSDWSQVNNFHDETNGLTKSGFIIFDRTTSAHKSQFNNSSYHSYWFRFRIENELFSDVRISLKYLPYYEIGNVGTKGQVVTNWDFRPCYVFDKAKYEIFIPKIGYLNALNGEDLTILRAGDGRKNAIKAMTTLPNPDKTRSSLLIVWQEEKGEKGGCTTLFEETTATLLSDRVGIMNSKSFAVVDGVLVATETEQNIRTVVFWLSRHGVMMSEGETVWCISDAIQNYFDPTKPECVNLQQTDKMWLNYDAAYGCLRLGLITGTSTIPNIFPVYHIATRAWGFDTFPTGQELSCLINVDSAIDDNILQIVGGASDGFVYQSNYGTDDAGNAITALCTIEFDGEGAEIHHKKLFLRAKAQEAGNIKISVSRNANPAFDFIETLSLSPLNPGEQIRRLGINYHQKANHFSYRFEGNVPAGGEIYLLDMVFTGYSIDYDSRL